jgi:hypothetical protein
MPLSEQQRIFMGGDALTGWAISATRKVRVVARRKK